MSQDSHRTTTVIPVAARGGVATGRPRPTHGRGPHAAPLRTTPGRDAATGAARVGPRTPVRDRTSLPAPAGPR